MSIFKSVHKRNLKMVMNLVYKTYDSIQILYLQYLIPNLKTHKTLDINSLINSNTENDSDITGPLSNSQISIPSHLDLMKCKWFN